jgi:hypothetical protein
MPEVNSASKLVDLLAQAGLLKAEERSEAINMSRQTGLDVTKLLTMHGYVSERVIKLGQEAISMLQQQQIDNFIAVKAIAKAAEKNLDLPAALELIYQQGIAPVKTVAAPSPMSLSELLSEGGFVETIDMERHQATGRETGLPLGKVILMRTGIDNDTMMRVLTAQVYSYQTSIKRDDIIGALRLTRQKQISYEEALERLNISIPPPFNVANIRLGELLTRAGIVQASNIIGALESSITQSKLLGEELIALGQLDKPTLDLALTVQNMVSRSKLRADHAAPVLKRLREQNCSWPDVLTEVVVASLVPGDVLHLEHLLRYSGPVQEEVLTRTRDAFDRKGTMSVGEYCRMLASTGGINDKLLRTAVRLVYLLKLNFLTPQQAILAMQHAQKRNIYADEAIHELSGL